MNDYENDRIRVTIYFRDGTQDEFYAESSYSTDSTLVYWNSREKNNYTIISYPIDTIKKIVEK